MKHTPGPWKIHKMEIYSDTPKLYPICRMLMNASTTHNDMEANAHLIAATPDLLEACKAVINDAIWDGKNRQVKECLVKMDTIEMVRQAISKAEGRDEG